MIEILQNNLVLLISLAAVFGLMIGSFINVVIYRLPVMLFTMWTSECEDFLKEKNHIETAEKKHTERFNLAWPSSHCPGCKHKLGILENIPVTSHYLNFSECGDLSNQI